MGILAAKGEEESVSEKQMYAYTKMDVDEMVIE